MQRSCKLLLAALIMVAQPSPFEFLEAQEGPHNVDWGARNPEDTARDIYNRLRLVAGTQEEIHFHYDSLRYLDEAGSPGVAIAPPAQGKPFEIIVTAGIFDLCHNENEIAHIVAHELSHVVLRHQSRLEDYILERCANWLSSHPDYEGLSGPAMLFLCLHDSTVDSDVAARYRQQEQEADNEAINLMELAGFNTSTATALFNHVADFLWAISDAPNVKYIFYEEPGGDASLAMRQRTMDGYIKKIHSSPRRARRRSQKLGNSPAR